MDLQEILTEVGEEKAAIIQAAIATEKKLGVDASKKKGAENTKLIAENARLKDGIKEVLGIEDLGEDPVDTIKQTITTLKAAKPKELDNNTDAIKAIEAKFQKQLSVLQTTIAEKEKAAELAQTKFRNAKITSQLSELMSGKFQAHDLAIKDWIREGKVKLDEGDQIVFVGSDETETIEPKKWLESFAIDRPDLVISQQIPGGGSTGKRVDVSKAKQMTLADFNSLELVDKAKFMSGGGTVI